MIEYSTKVSQILRNNYSSYCIIFFMNFIILKVFPYCKCLQKKAFKLQIFFKDITEFQNSIQDCFKMGDGGGVDRTSTFRGELLGKREVTFLGEVAIFT